MWNPGGGMSRRCYSSGGQSGAEAGLVGGKHVSGGPRQSGGGDAGKVAGRLGVVVWCECCSLNVYLVSVDDERVSVDEER